MDYSTALADGAGIVVAQGLTQPSHLGSIRRRWPASWRAPGAAIDPGDVFIMNDPYAGACIFRTSSSSSRSSHRTTDRLRLHNLPSQRRRRASRRLHGRLDRDLQEGLRIPPLKLYRAGTIDPAIIALIEGQCSHAAKLIGESQGSTCRLRDCRTRDVKLSERFGSTVS